MTAAARRCGAALALALAFALAACGRGGDGDADKGSGEDAASKSAGETASADRERAGSAHALAEYAPKSADASIKEVSLGTSDRDEFDANRVATEFPQGTDRVFVWYRWEDAEPGKRVDIRWSHQGQIVLEQGEPFGGAAGNAAWFLKLGAGGALPPGSYQVELLENGTVVTTIPFTVTEAST